SLPRHPPPPPPPLFPYTTLFRSTGATTIIRGCRAWWNSDDGYDLINQEVPVTVESSWAMGNGYAMYGTVNPSQGNGNGFKMGSRDRKSTRLNSSHVAISYAVFCL